MSLLKTPNLAARLVGSSGNIALVQATLLISPLQGLAQLLKQYLDAINSILLLA